MAKRCECGHKKHWHRQWLNKPTACLHPSKTDERTACDCMEYRPAEESLVSIRARVAEQPHVGVDFERLKGALGSIHFIGNCVDPHGLLKTHAEIGLVSRSDQWVAAALGATDDKVLETALEGFAADIKNGKFDVRKE